MPQQVFNANCKSCRLVTFDNFSLDFSFTSKEVRMIVKTSVAAPDIIIRDGDDIKVGSGATIEVKMHVIEVYCMMLKDV